MPQTSVPRRTADGEAKTPVVEVVELRMRRGRLAKSAGSVLAGRVLNFGLQAAYFVLLAQLLVDAGEYGRFSGVFAMVSTVTPYSAAGSAMLFLRYVSCDAELAAVYWGNSLVIAATFTSGCCVLALVLGRFGHALSQPYMTATLLVANCLFSQVTVLAGMLLFCLEHLRASAVLNTISNAARLVAVLLLKALGHRIFAWQWALALTAASMIAAAYALWRVERTIGAPKVDLPLLRLRLGEGLGFSFAGSTEVVNNDIDKLMLVHFGLTVQNGFYTLAYRLIDFATAPVASIAASVTQRQFQLAGQGIRAVAQLAWKSGLVGIGVGLALILPTRAMAHWIPNMAGASYAGAAEVIYWLCWLPAIRAVHLLAGAAVTGLGQQPLRTAVQAFAAILSIALNLLWIPRYGWKGAASATLICDGAMAVLNVAVLLLLNIFWSRLREPNRAEAAA